MLPRFPDSFGANELMGLVLASEGKENAANPFFAKAVEIQPDSGDAHENLATNLLRLKKVNLAEQEFRRAVLLKPNDYSTNHSLGEFYIQYGKLTESVPYLKKAQMAKPDSYANGYDLAVAEVQCDMLNDAAKQIDALMRVGDTADLHALLAAVKEKQQDYLLAAREYQRAAQMDPSENNIFAWGAELLGHRTPEPAIQVLSRGVELYPQSARLQIGLGIGLFMRESYDRAVDAFCHAVDLDPRDRRPYYFLARIYAISPSRAPDVTSRLRHLVQLQPRDAQARYYYAMSLWKAARVEAPAADLAEVESLLRAAIDLDHSYADAHLQLGIICSEEKRDSEALDHFEQAVKLDPNLADAHYRLGQALLKSGDRARGQKELQISSQLHTQQLDAREKLTSEILRFVYTGPNSLPAQLTPH
ncbi:MAG TPA: tetratricopeptide repeat protein [Terriglobia bacterium]|nr:tetratricopeptide repeat protein [Terriglobia bacterium]